MSLDDAAEALYAAATNLSLDEAYAVAEGVGEDTLKPLNYDSCVSAMVAYYNSIHVRELKGTFK